MKIKEIGFKNFSKYSNVVVQFDDEITYLVGPNGAGKSGLGTVGIQYIFQGIAEKRNKAGDAPVIGERFRFIGPDAKSASGYAILYDENVPGSEIKVIRKMTKDGTTLSFEAPVGMNLDQDWLTDLFNEFMISPKKFLALSSVEQSKALGIDTSMYDAKIKLLKDEFTVINRAIKDFGIIEEVEEVKPVVLDELREKKKEEADRLNKLYLSNVDHNKAVKKEWDQANEIIKASSYDHNLQVVRQKKAVTNAETALRMLLDTSYTGNEVSDHIAALKLATEEEITPEMLKERLLPEPELKEAITEGFYVKELPDNVTLLAIDQEILTAVETNQKAKNYTDYLQKLNDKAAKEKELQDNKDSQRDMEQDRTDYIKRFKFPFESLTVDEAGGLMSDGKPLKEPYFSTGELIKLVPMILSAVAGRLKYVFIQDFNLLDDDAQQQVEDYLTGEGFQLVIEYVSKKTLDAQKNCIYLRENKVVAEQDAISYTPDAKKTISNGYHPDDAEGAELLYESEREEVYARQWDGDMFGMIGFTEGSDMFTCLGGVATIQDTNKLVVTLDMGDWIIKRGNDQFDMYANDVYHTRFVTK
jgi:hypothetical protein